MRILKNTIALILMMLMLLNSVMISQGAIKPDGFRDVDLNAWYAPDVYALANLKIINGYSNGNFGPKDLVRVDELIKMVVASDGIILDNGKEYWAENYIKYAIQNNLISKDDFLRYDRPITRLEIVKIIQNRIGEYRSNRFLYEDDIDDFNDIPENCREAVLNTYAFGIIKGSNGCFLPNSNATRAEVSVILRRLVDSFCGANNKKKENSNNPITVFDMQDQLSKAGYTLDYSSFNIDEETILTREVALPLIYDCIFQNEELKDLYIPISEKLFDYITDSSNDESAIEAYNKYTQMYSNHLRTYYSDYESKVETFEDVIKNYSKIRVKDKFRQNTERNAFMEENIGCVAANLFSTAPDLEINLCGFYHINAIDYYAMAEKITKYKNGESRRVFIQNPFKERQDVMKEMLEGEWEYYTLEEIRNMNLSRVNPFDYTRFDNIFSDSDSINKEYKEKIYRLYDYGVIDSFYEDEYLYAMLFNPSELWTQGDLFTLIERFENNERSFIDEKIFKDENSITNYPYFGLVNVNHFILRLPYDKGIIHYTRNQRAVDEMNLLSGALTFKYTIYGPHIVTIGHLEDDMMTGGAVWLEPDTNTLIEKSSALRYLGDLTREQIEKYFSVSDNTILTTLIPKGYIGDFMRDIFDESKYELYEDGHSGICHKANLEYGNLQITIMRTLLYSKNETFYDYYNFYTR